ncbi:hypothetical protein HNQ95_000292 [Aminobacter ciceronei]|uniref:Uncharacterized protein n=2 Tax=Aminobacter ciceronei TaxID=150723 RepID=A0ABR6C020_9HYPH|nr:hypothetical protein [Aminobacter ciceronei]MBA9018307.1 hypothetical protein [Aminobacter ciceronei]
MNEAEFEGEIRLGMPSDFVRCFAHRSSGNSTRLGPACGCPLSAAQASACLKSSTAAKST